MVNSHGSVQIQIHTQTLHDMVEEAYLGAWRGARFGIHFLTTVIPVMLLSQAAVDTVRRSVGAERIYFQINDCQISSCFRGGQPIAFDLLFCFGPSFVVSTCLVGMTAGLAHGLLVGLRRALRD